MNTLFKMNVFEKLKFSPFNLQNTLLNNSNDHFLNANQFFDANKFKIEETNPKRSWNDDKFFSILHLNLRSLEKNFHNLVLFIATLNFNFKVICISETRCSSEHDNSDLSKLPNYSSIHQTRSPGKTGGSLAIFVLHVMTHSVRKGLSINTEDIEALSIEIINAKNKSILVNTRYRHPAEGHNEFEVYLIQFLCKS